MKAGRNIVLIGMPGAGKSTVGIVLAKVMGYRFLDSDLVIQEAEGKLLKDIIAEEGIEGFIEIEERINAEIEASYTVIATGGSVIYGSKAMEHLKEIGDVLYLRLSFPEIRQRLGDVAGRGVVLKQGQTLEDLYQERCPLYEKYADIVIEAENKTIEKLALEMQKELAGRHFYPCSK